MRASTGSCFFALLIWAIVASVPAGVGLAQQSPGPTTAVVGQVVDASSGSALADAKITITSGRPPLRSVMSGPTGAFAFSGLTPGTYWLSASHPAYADGALGQRFPQDAQLPIRIEATSKLFNVKLRLWKQAAISGIARDANGEVIVDAKVVAMRRTVGPTGVGRFTVTRSAATDDQGRYRLFGLVPGTYAVAIVLSELKTDGQDDTPMAKVSSSVFYPMAATVEDATLLTVRSGDDLAGVDLQNPNAAGVSISGLLITPSAISSRAVDVSLLPISQDGSASEIPRAVCRSTSNGRFSFANVVPGRYSLRALDIEVRGLPSVVTNPLAGAPKNRITGRDGGVSPAQTVSIGTTVWAEQSVVVKDRPLDNVQLPLQAGLTISGRVAIETPKVSQTSLLLDQVPLLVKAAGESELPKSPITNLRSDGAFSTIGLPPGQYVLSVALPAEWTANSVSVAGVIRTGALEVSDHDLRDVLITVTDRAATLAGHVFGQGERGADGASVYLFPTDRAQWTRAAVLLGAAQQVRSEADGSFTFSRFPPGDYFVVADTAGAEFWMDPAFLAKLAPRGERIHIADGDRKTTTLHIPPDR